MQYFTAPLVKLQREPRPRFVLLLVLAGIVQLLCALPAQAQFRASIQGSVTDPTGAVIPGAQITLVDMMNNYTVHVTSNGAGNYNINALPADSFRITVQASGFASRTLENVRIIPEQPNTINLQLKTGDVAEKITVDEGEVPALDTTTASISGTVTSNQIQHMPSFDRNVFRLVALAPGTFGDGSQSNGGNEKNMPGEDHGGPAANDGGIFETENNPQVIGNGSQVSANNILIDGISTSSANWGGASVITPSEDSVDYMKVTSNAYDAEFGRFSGNAVQVTSKSGTNSYHGSLFFKVDRPGLNAWQRWNGQSAGDPINAGKAPAVRGLAKSQSRFNQFGGSIGGPILHNKLFAFFNYETLRLGATTYGTPVLFETASYRASAPTSSIAAKYLAYPGEAPAAVGQTNATCAGNLGIADGPYCHALPDGTLDVGSPLHTALGSHDTTWVSTTHPGIGSGLDGIGDLQLLATASPNKTTASQYNGRLDADVTSKDRLGFVIYWVPLSNIAYNGVNRAANLWNHYQTNNAFTILWNRTFSPTLLNEARASASGWRWNELASNAQAPFGLPQDTFVGVGPTEPQYFGPQSPSAFNQWTYSYQDIVTKVAGRHNLKMGATLWHVEFLNESLSNARPTFTFNSFWDFLNDAPFGEKGNFNAQTGAPALNRQDYRMNIFGAFVQDDFRVTPTLTLNLGLRWNYFGSPYAKQNNLSVVVPGAGSAMLTGLVMRQGGSLYTVQKGDFSPQTGFAWTPTAFAGKFVVRGGIGINYNENEFAVTVQGYNNTPQLIALNATGYAGTNPAIQYNVPADVHSALGYPANTSVVTTFNNANLPNTGTVSVTGFDQHAKTIMVYHYSLDTETQLPYKFVATLGYQGSQARHLLYQVNLNAVAVAKGYALNPSISGVSYNANGANSNYNAMLATLKHNFSHSFQIEGQYTWSKSMDEGSSPYTQDAYAPISIHQVYGRSDYNVQNAFRIFGLYQPNFFHEKWLHIFADGWSLSGIYNWHTGFPWSPTYPVTTNGAVGGTAGTLYYIGSPYSSIRPAKYTGTGLVSYSTVAFESGPTPSNPTAHNVNFPTGTGGENYFVAPAYTATPKVTYNAATTTPAPPPAIERNSFNGPGFQNFDLSLTKGFNIPPARVIGSHARFEFRVDAYNLFNLTNLTPTPTTSIVSTNFGVSTSALGSRTVQLQTRFSF